jgi:hypothetical protein
LDERFRALTHALQPLGIEVGPEALALWKDRDAHGRDPLPDKALEELSDVTTLMRWGDL